MLGIHFSPLGGSADFHKLLRWLELAGLCDFFVASVLKAVDVGIIAIVILLLKRLTGVFLSTPGGRKLFLPACYQEHNAANERHCACDGRQRYIMCLVACSVNRSDVNDFFAGRVCKTSPRKTEQTKRNQDNSKRLVHGASFGGCS